MSFAAGRPVIAIPGPSPVPDRVLRAMHRAGADIYGAEPAQDNATMREGLMRLAGTQQNLATYIGNGHCGWEAATQNLLGPGDKALVIVSGLFGQGWAQHAAELGVEVEVLDQPRDAAPSPAALAARLAEDRDHSIRAVLVAQIDTASSIRADIPALRAAMGDHPALFAVDAIASLGCEEMRMDDWGVDVLVSASQKGLMCPPGLAFVWYSERAAESARRASPCWRWAPRRDAEALWQHWCGTPPLQLIWAMNEALAMLTEEGLPATFARHDGLARAVWAAFDAWGAGNPAIRLQVGAPEGRARSVTAAQIPGADALRAWCAQKAGVTLGIGIGSEAPENALRVAHMGHASAQTLLGVLAVMQAGMEALSIPHGAGALDAAAREIARLA